MCDVSLKAIKVFLFLTMRKGEIKYGIQFLTAPNLSSLAKKKPFVASAFAPQTKYLILHD